MPEPRAILWDLDGTLVDSDECHFLTWRDTLAGEGFALTAEHFGGLYGLTTEATIRTVFGADVAPTDVVRIAGAKEERYRALVRQGRAPALPEVAAWLVRLRAEGWRQSIASSACRANIDAVLAALDLASRLDAIVSSEDVRHGKPDPEVFLTAAARLGVSPSRCVVVEDSAHGVEAAHRAGMRAIAVGRRHADLTADLAVPTLLDLAPDAFDRLVPPS